MSSEPWTLGRLLDWTAQYLRDKNAETPRLDAEVLLANTVGCQRIQLYTRFDEPAGEEVRAKYRDLIRKRVEGCPVAYLVGYKEFYNLRFAVSPAVLIPRPETELLVLQAITLAKPIPQARIVDVGTGSGAIAITLAKHLPGAHITAIDVSPEALDIARANAQTHQVSPRITFLLGDLLAPLPTQEPFDLIVSNPPYIAQSEWAALPPSVAKFEPRSALDGGPDGLLYIHRLITDSPQRLRPGSYLLLEIGAAQFKSAQELLEKQGCYQAITILPDHAGLPRVAKAQLKS
jgi:release factor glutamine methyltransferase